MTIAHPAWFGATLLAVASLFLTPFQAQADEPSAPPADEAKADSEEPAVRELLRNLVAAFDAKDLDALGKLLSDKVLLVDSDGVSTSGREAVLDQYAAAFQDSPKATIKGTLDSLEFLTDDIARGEGTFRLDPEPGDTDPIDGRFSILAIRQDKTWLLVEMRDYPAAPEESTGGSGDEETLREFEWMIGSWVDESDDARVTSDIRWSLNRNFIIRDYRIEVAGKQAISGLMVLGYDPQASQVKSWVFDSEGGYGEAYWTRVNDNQWVLRSRGCLRDGTSTSASQVITLLGDDRVRQNSLDRMIGGRFVPEVTEIHMVRRPPAPHLKPGQEASESDEPTQPTPTSDHPTDH